MKVSFIMKRNIKFFLIGLGIALVLGVGVVYFTSSESVDEVVDSIAEDFDLRSKSVGTNDAGHFIYINLKNREDIPEVEQILEKRLSRKDLDKYRRSEEHTSELQSRGHLVCRLLLEK